MLDMKKFKATWETKFCKFEQFDIAEKFNVQGVCAPLCIIWLQSFKDNSIKDFREFVTSQAGFEVCKKLLEQQKLIPTQYAANYLKPFGFEEVKHYSHAQIKSSGAFNLLSQPGCYIIYLTKDVHKNFSSHAIAVNGFKLKMYDPNTGQIRMENFDPFQFGFMVCDYIDTVYKDYKISWIFKYI